MSKSNTAPLCAQAIVTYRNSKEHPKNKVKQKKLSQINRNILAPSIKLKQKSEQKELENQKKRVSRKKSFNLLPK